LAHILLEEQAKMENHVIEVGEGVVPTILLFTLIYMQNRIEPGSYNCDDKST
jgi:hypothetical protein